MELILNIEIRQITHAWEADKLKICNFLYAPPNAVQPSPNLALNASASLLSSLHPSPMDLKELLLRIFFLFFLSPYFIPAPNSNRHSLGHPD